MERHQLSPLGVLLFALPLAFSFFLPKILLEPSGTGDAEKSVQRLVRYSFTLKNTTSEHLTDIRFSTFSPVPETPYQSVVSIDASHEFQTVLDELGNQKLVFDVSGLSPFSSLNVVITAKVALWSAGRANWQSSGVFSSVRDTASPMSLPELIRQTNVRWEGESDQQWLRSVVGWTSETLERLPYQSRPIGLSETIRNQGGDCTEFMGVLHALAADRGLSSIGVSGFISRQQSKLLKPEDLHNWNLIQSGNRWLLGDAYYEQASGSADHYIAFDLIPPARMAEPITHRFSISNSKIDVSMN
ncbi:hypothetical protein [Marinobacter xestospongiae]|uniref:Transglutaminase-like domain-containing protein n=1 Tax=Marinobacter xestospongiae TaxID=994319 RepID=A0ABU3VW57_9GAMM|nr:hypothetical protein [Marinobacter xestospongiae]MDV2078513.1 hypothetical protein [Marinobacter xestospongiae]